MNERIQTQVKTAEKSSSFAPTRSGLLQRKCTCGGKLGMGGECAECRRKRLLGLQRNRVDQEADRDKATSIVHDDVLRSPRQPLDAETRTSTEATFGHDFGRILLHTGQ